MFSLFERQHWCAGSLVKAGQKLAVLSAMKMETALQSPCDGLVRHVGVDKGDSVEAGKSSGPSSETSSQFRNPLLLSPGVSEYRLSVQG